MRVLAVAGPSGGHIFPAVGFLDNLKDKPGIDALLILPQNTTINNLENSRYQTGYISVSNIKLSLNLKNFAAVLNFFKGTLQSSIILLSFKPDIVVGFGSLVSVPLIFLAWFFRINTLIHEQNAVPGRANMFLAKFADKIAVSFAETKDYFNGCAQKLVVTGNPVRKELTRIDKVRALDFFGLNQDKFTVLVMGGSTGAHKINIEFLKALPLISDKSRLQVIHLAGSKDLTYLENSYKDSGINVKLFDFLRPMQYAYSACDLILSRAGASTISEIIFFKAPAILVPYPFAYKHQLNNAKVLEKINSAVIINDDELNALILKEAIESLMNNPEKIKAMRDNYDNIYIPAANESLVNEALALSQRGHFSKGIRGHFP